MDSVLRCLPRARSGVPLNHPQRQKVLAGLLGWAGGETITGGEVGMTEYFGDECRGCGDPVDERRQWCQDCAAVQKAAIDAALGE
jgi:hypothetical protein